VLPFEIPVPHSLLLRCLACIADLVSPQGVLSAGTAFELAVWAGESGPLLHAARNPLDRVVETEPQCCPTQVRLLRFPRHGLGTFAPFFKIQNLLRECCSSSAREVPPKGRRRALCVPCVSFRALLTNRCHYNVVADRCRNLSGWLQSPQLHLDRRRRLP
jgi:hypothetical protein